ncbi:hypothetical protein D051_0163 [Vibrio parahaemolyticus VPCR-2010]|uniref:DUF6638 family protein n=1 Tax=Vibrio parahaemolyticus TaxID=670 RepID=UPI00038E58DE|nr:hypothetical protein D051_0163 [Vibrio parahaemolyticus VPCR-2010]
MNYTKQLESMINSQLLLVNKPHMVERYNNALASLTGKRTALSEFHIDICGYSPEIAAEMEDSSFLNPNGVNRQFIIIDVRQANLRSISLSFSSTPFVIKKFINDNKNEIMALTALDSVFGEIENNVIRVECLSDILNIHELSIICDTPKKIIKTNQEIAGKVSELRNSDSIEFLLEEKLEDLASLCRKTPSISYDCYLPKQNKYKKTSVFTNHYGGFYRIYLTNGEKYLIFMDEKKFPHDQVPKGIKCINFQEIDKVIEILLKSRMLVDRNGSELQEVKEHLSKIRERIVIDHLASSQGVNHESVDSYIINQMVRDNPDDLPVEFHEISRIISKLTRSERIKVTSKYILYTHKVNGTLLEGEEGSYLINHLMSNYMNFSYNKLFQYNLDVFKERFAKWTDAKKAYVLSCLKV